MFDILVVGIVISHDQSLNIASIVLNLERVSEYFLCPKGGDLIKYDLD